jgi:hypothetical protein
MIATDELKRKFGIEAALMVIICRAFMGTSDVWEAEAFIHENSIDWPYFYRLTTTHQVRPVIYKILYKLAIPDEIKQQLQADCKQIAIHNLEHARELARIYELLEGAGITAIPYKGAAFCLAYYKDIGLREFSDIDFLVNPSIEDLDKIKSALLGLGYTDPSDIPADFKETNFYNTREYYVDLYEDDRRKFHAEFHWFTASQFFDFPTALPMTLLLEGAIAGDIYGKKIQVLNDSHHFIAMATHHGLNQRWNLMKYSMDLAVILTNGKTLDWGEINAVSKTYGFNKSVNLGYYIADNLLGIKPGIAYEIPADGNSYINDLLSVSSKKRKGTTEHLLQSLKIKDTFADKVKMVFKYIRYSANPSILDYRFVKLPRNLFFLYLLVKPVRMAANYFRRG